MIIGNGMLAKAFRPHFQNNSKILIFASGVSNSACTDPALFKREADLLSDALLQQLPIVYFGTCSTNDSELAQTPYVRHKLEMETRVRNAHRFWIFRLPQVVGPTDNPHTLTNFLADRLRAGETIWIWKRARRNLIDLEDATALIRYILTEQLFADDCTNIAAPIDYSIEEIVSALERATGMRANTVVIDRGAHYTIDVGRTEPLWSRCKVIFSADYLARVLGKYYGINRTI